jgi:hypothetical protein
MGGGANESRKLKDGAGLGSRKGCDGVRLGSGSERLGDWPRAPGVLDFTGAARRPHNGAGLGTRKDCDGVRDAERRFLVFARALARAARAVTLKAAVESRG